MPETLAREAAVFSLFIYYPEVWRDDTADALSEFMKVHGPDVRRSISFNYSFDSEILVTVPTASGETRIMTFGDFSHVEPTLNALFRELAEAGLEVMIEHIQVNAAADSKPTGVIQFYFYEK